MIGERRPRRERAVDGDARVREREERHDDVARPGVKELLQPLVRRDRRAELRGARARASSAVGCSRNSRKRSVARSRLRARRRDRRTSSRPMARPTTTGSTPDFSSADPGDGPEHEADESGPHAAARRSDEDGGEERPSRRAAARTSNVLRVDHRDDDERHDVVDDDDREHERAQPVGNAWADQREQAERERGVGRHRDSPAAARTSARVEAR